MYNGAIRGCLMVKLFCLPLLAVFSFSALADVSFQEKKNRVQYLEELTNESVSMNIDAYRRELQYEKQNLPLDKRAENEAMLLTEKIQVQIQKAYEAALSDSTPEEAASEVRNAIDKDLELLDPELKEEIRKISYQTLENAQLGIASSDLDISGIARVLMKGVQDRHQFLNEEGEDFYGVAPVSQTVTDETGRAEYKTKKQLLEALVADREGLRMIRSANMTLKSDTISRREGKVNLQVKAEFLGVEIEAGPTITFSRLYRTSVNLNAEGMNPIIKADGSFDFFKQNSKQRRFMTFACEAELVFESEYSGAGGFTFVGMGGNVTTAKKYSNKVVLTTRRLAVPEILEGKVVSLNYLNNLCHLDFLRTRVTNTMTVSDSLNIMMKNMVAGLKFSHPKTTCMVDSHCYNWFNREVVALMKLRNTPRCVENSAEKYRTCELRGLSGQNCAVYDSTGKRISDGMFEFKCDTGYKCVKVQDAGWFKGGSLYQYAKGRCQKI